MLSTWYFRTFSAGKMALWNKVSSGFDTEEETVNFGTRAVVENNGSLYETSTIAIIQSEGQIVKAPNVSASVQCTKLCIAVDKSITIFEDETCKQISLNVNFNLEIACYCISNDGLFLFVVLSNGTLYCLHLSVKPEVIFTKNVAVDSNGILKIVLQNESNDHINIYLVTKGGSIYRLSNFNTKLIKDAVLNGNQATVKELTTEIQCEQLFKGISSSEVNYVAIGFVNEEISIAMLDSNMLYMWPSEQYSNFSTLCYKYTKIEFFRKHMSMLCLCGNYMLHAICPQTLLSVKVYQESVSDFEIIEHNDNNDNSLCQILVLAKTDDDCTTITLRVLSFPEFEQKFQINVPIITYLVKVMDPCDETILFLEGVNDSENRNNCIDTIRIKTIAESLPELRLQRLLRREQFDAAEAFAREFNLSMESIYCKKVSLLLSKLGPWAKKDSDPVQLNDLLNIFDKIENVQFVVECCSKALIPEYKQMRKIHLYARERIIKNNMEIKTDEQFSALFLINDMLHKLETFHFIWGYKQDDKYYDDGTMNEWIRFSRANLMEEYKRHLSLGEMEEATLIWTRHLPDIIKYISVETVKDIFAVLPDNVSPSCLWPWLSHFIPSLLSFTPDAMCEIITWVCKKMKSFEQLHRASWPEIGIDFSSKFIKLLKFEESQQSLYFHQEYLNKDSVIKKLVSTIQAMSDIKKLKTNYRLTIALDSYIGDPIEVSYVLLDKIHVELIPEFVNTFLKQYMLNNCLKHDSVFSSYIQKTMRNSKSWWSGEEGPWERRVVVIINLIQNKETKLQQTLEVLKKASVPWSSTMTTLAEESSNMDHALASQIKIEYNCVPIKIILKKYGYERIGINDQLINRIIRQNHSDMISHIHQLTKNDSSLRKTAFSSCVNHYLSKGNSEKAMELLNSLETDVLLHCCVYIVNYVTARLTLKVLKDLKCYIEMFGWIKLQLKEISQKCKTQSHYCNGVILDIDVVKSRYLLRKEFQINVTLKEHYLEKRKILQKYIEQLCNAMENDIDLPALYGKVIKAADLLRIERLDAISSLLEFMKNIDIFKYFTMSNGGQMYLMPDECKYIYKICSTMLQHVKMDTNTAFILKNLISSAVCVCSDDELPSLLTLYTWANLYQECFSENTVDCLDSVDAKEKCLRTNWKLYTIHKESAAISADEFLLPLFKKMVSMHNSHISDSGAEHTVIQESAKNCRQLEMEESLQKLLDEMKILNIEHNNYYLLQLIKTFYFNFCIVSDMNPTLIMETKSMHIHYVIALLKKLMSTRAFDLQFTLSCLFMLSESEASKWISVTSKSFQSDCTRHFKVSMLGYEYYRLMKNQPLMKSYKSNKLLHHWAQKLSKYSVSYKEVVTSDYVTRREILQRIMNHSDDGVIFLLQDFCSDFGFDIQDCLLLYLQTIIKTWNPTLKISKKELRIQEDEVNELKTKCNAVAAKISNEAVLKNCIASIYSQVNFYYYEVFIILMELIEDENIEHRNYLCFLQNYTRSGQPTKIEHDEWMHLNPEYTSLPPIAEWRLPFLPKVELWTLITPELNLKTYDKWLDIAPILKLQQHIICTLAIKGEVMSTWGNKHEKNNWSLYPKNTGLLEDVKKCINRMTGPNALYYSTAALYYVVNYTPPGADQVAAIKECYEYTQVSAQESIQFETEILEKIKFKYLRFTSEHILHTYGLGIKKYLSLIGNPSMLIRELYMDESIPQRYRSVIDHRPDVNSAVSSISQLFSINIMNLQMELLQEWLQPDVKYTAFNETMTDTFSVTTSEPNSSSDDNLLRGRYILESGDLEMYANFLIHIGFNDSKEDYSPEICYRALQVLQAIVNREKLEDLTKRDYQNIRKYMKSLKYISKLESLGINYSISTFEMCSKQELIRILWKTQSYLSVGLVVIAQICIDFKIYEYSIWDKTLTKLAKLRMIHELKKILLQVRNINIITNSNGYLAGWQVVVSEPFKKMYIQPTSKQINDCIEALQLMYSCPVIHMFCFDDIVKYCFQCQQPHLAAVLLPFLNDEKQEHVLNTIKNTFDVTKVLEDLNNLSLNGILCIHYCNKIIQNTLLKING